MTVDDSARAEGIVQYERHSAELFAERCIVTSRFVRTAADPHCDFDGFVLLFYVDAIDLLVWFVSHCCDDRSSVD